MTDPAGLDLLFDPSLISPTVRPHLGNDLVLRPLASTDGSRGLFELFSVLTAAPKLSPGRYTDVFEQLKERRDTYFTIVILQKSTNSIVACGTIFIERKFIHSGGIVGHIEDIAVSKVMQGRKLGQVIINTLQDIGAAMGCYKIILDCSRDNIPFYEKCGFNHKECQMVQYISDRSNRGPLSPRL